MVERTFPDGASVATYAPGDPTELAAAVERLADEPLAREAAVARALTIVRSVAWERESEPYLRLVESLAEGSRP
jgi:hypothetical protein